MKSVAFIGYFDKTDLILCVAKVLVSAGKKALVVDATIEQKLSYITPAIKEEKTQVINFEDYDIAVGFSSISDIEKYLKNNSETSITYDYILIDSDNVEGCNNYDLGNANYRYYTSSLDIMSVKKGLELLESINKNDDVEFTKIIYNSYATTSDAQYIDIVSRDMNIKWNNKNIYMPYEQGDLSAAIQNQHAGKVRIKNYSLDYKNAVLNVCKDVLQEENFANLKKILKNIER